MTFKEYMILPENVSIPLDELAQKYADEQTIKALRWFEIEKQANRIPGTIGYDEIVTRYHESQKP